MIDIGFFLSKYKNIKEVIVKYSYSEGLGMVDYYLYLVGLLYNFRIREII